MDILLWLVAGAFVLIYWLDTAKARENAVAHGRRACKDMQYQFLDGSVIRYRTRVTRSPSGQLCVLRSFRFEFTITGQYRYQGYMALAGNSLRFLELDDPEPETPAPNHSLILSASYSEDTDAIRPRVEKRTDCCH